MRSVVRVGLATLAAVWMAAGVADEAGKSGPVSSANSTLHWNVKLDPAHAKAGEEVDVVLTADIAPGWILYSSDFSVEIGPRPTKFTFDANPSLSLQGPIVAVKPEWKKDASLGSHYSYFAQRAEFRQKVRVLGPLSTVSGRINGQTCFEESGLCELFQEKFSAKL